VNPQGMNLIHTIDDPRRRDHAQRIQLMRWCIKQIRSCYSDTTLAFLALGAASDALEMTQCAVACEIDGYKLLPLVKSLRKIMNRV